MAPQVDEVWRTLLQVRSGHLRGGLCSIGGLRPVVWAKQHWVDAGGGLVQPASPPRLAKDIHGEGTRHLHRPVQGRRDAQKYSTLDGSPTCVEQVFQM